MLKLHPYLNYIHLVSRRAGVITGGVGGDPGEWFVSGE